MKTIFCYLSLILLTGCSAIASSSKNIENNSSTVECTEKPSLELKTENVEEVAFANKTLNLSSKATSDRYIGYTFEAEAGQKLSYKTDSDLCIWVYTPDNELVNGTKLEKAGTYTIQISTPKGSTTFDLEMSLEIPSITTAYSQEQQSTATFNQNNSDSSVVQNNYTTTTKQVDFTEGEALEIVKGWYRAKPQIFGSSFNTSLVDEYTTGQLYYKTTQKDGGGSMGWLQRSGCYYTYPFSNIDNVWLFSTSETRPLLKIKVSEEIQLHGPSSAGCGNRPISYSKTVSYWFEKENENWKIYDYEVE